MHLTMQSNYQASYMPEHLAEKTGSKAGKGPPSFLIEQNEDILNLLQQSNEK